jgi:thiosulfate dehydrogenase (quinone) large subunit
MKHPDAFLGSPAEREPSRVTQWLVGSKILAVGWTAMRVWLGIMWIQAGVAKLWGAENSAFLHNNGAGVAGFVAHGFVVPNSGSIGILVAVAEFSIGVALVLGFFTRTAALASLALLFTYVMSGTASVCAFYALFAIVIMATWRTSSWIGVDGLIASYLQRHNARQPAEENATGIVGLAAKAA